MSAKCQGTDLQLEHVRSASSTLPHSAHRVLGSTDADSRPMALCCEWLIKQQANFEQNNVLS